MARYLGLCRWCREAVDTTQARFATLGREVVHAECMEEYLQQGWGLRRLAALAGFEFYMEEDEELGAEGRATGLVSVLPDGQWQERIL